MKFTQVFIVALVVVCAGCTTAAPDTRAADEAAIKALEARFTAAFKARDITAIMANYVPDQSLLVFDVAPPRQIIGADGYKKDWEGYLTAFPGPWDLTLSDLEITVGGDVAYGHNVQRTAFTDQAGKKTEVTVRVTDGYKKINGQWLISHEHVSVPVDLATMKPDLDSK